MPRSPLRPCPVPGCPNLTRGGRCPFHAQVHEHQRGSSTQRGYGYPYRLWRARILRRDPTCTLCGVEPSTVADHLVPQSRGGENTMENGRGLCARCHDRRKDRE